MSFYPLIFCRLRKQPTPYPNFPLIKCLPRAVTTTEIRGSKETGRGHGIRLHHCAVMIQTHTILLTTTWRKQERVLNYLKQSPCNMTSDERVQKFHTDDVSLPHIWVVLLIGWKFASSTQKHYPDLTRHQYGISAFVSQTSSHGDTTGGVVKCQLFSQASIFAQEEELRARKREALMQQSRREAQLSRLRFEEQRLKVRQACWKHISLKILYNPLVRSPGGTGSAGFGGRGLGGSYLLEASLGREGLSERGHLFNLTKCVAKNKKRGRNRLELWYPTSCFGMGSKGKKTTIATNNKQPEDGLNSP